MSTGFIFIYLLNIKYNMYICKNWIGTNGNEIIPPKYDWVHNFKNGRAIIIFMGCEGEIDLDSREYFSQEDLATLRKYRLPQIIDSL
jgi:hypothetical protein